MPIERIAADDFLNLMPFVPVFDVRSPGEFSRAHLPDACSLPIFNDEERAIIGTAYKQESREQAIRSGLQFYGPKLLALVDQVLAHFRDRKIDHRKLVVHCWRGGMRSAAVAWLLDLYGFEVFVIKGGYKAVRKLLLAEFEKDRQLIIIGGYTGSNKTGLLQVMKKRGKTIIDLEDLAAHKGSAFGNLEQLIQPSQEMFENLLGIELYKNRFCEHIWLEGESQRIGLINIPLTFYQKMRQAPMVFLNVPFESRLAHIIEGYGKASKEKLINAIIRLQKRLGGLETKNAIAALLENDMATCFSILLLYYDRWYLRSAMAQDASERKVIELLAESTNEEDNYDLLMQHVRSISI